MNEEHDKAWKDLAKRAHRGEGHVISGGAADRLLRSLPDECMAEADVDAIVESIVSGRSLRAIRGSEVSPTEDQGGVDAPKQQDIASENDYVAPLRSSGLPKRKKRKAGGGK